jgi:hypothetical protein
VKILRIWWRGAIPILRKGISFRAWHLKIDPAIPENFNGL